MLLESFLLVAMAFAPGEHIWGSQLVSLHCRLPSFKDLALVDSIQLRAYHCSSNLPKSLACYHSVTLSAHPKDKNWKLQQTSWLTPKDSGKNSTPSKDSPVELLTASPAFCMDYGNGSVEKTHPFFEGGGTCQHHG